MSNEDQQPDGDLRVEQMDPAQQQLAKALRSSFRLLSFLMIFVLILFAVREVTSIGPNEVGIVYRFGRIQDDVVEEGLAFAWPFMIGRVEKIDTSQKEIEINDFWIFEKPEERTTPLIERNVPLDGLRPGYDGALLTGDQSLYHVRLRCEYQIRSGNNRLDENIHPAIQYKLNVTDPPAAAKMVRSAVCSAAIHAARQRTIDDLYSNRGNFAEKVGELAQERLDILRSGMKIVNVSVTDSTWPLQALRDFAAAEAAKRKNKAVTDAARAQASRILQLVAGNTYKQLVGDPIDRKDQDQKDKDDGVPYDLIGQYARSRATGTGANTDESEAILTRINKVLSRTEGIARKLIDDAQTKSTEFTEATKRRAGRFTELLPKYNENPEFMLAAEWSKVLSAIFASPTVEVVIVGAGDRKVVIHTKQDPETVARIVRELARIKAAHIGRNDK
ncbi:MAG: SPFH domain-containing protein [Phycisphaerae bacterium]|jgi:regulator of protease activity HflC (stomatin/prohibitin superfamily)|nr:SPFH domain-containing protein [Phycisphaerae bacterium]